MHGAAWFDGSHQLSSPARPGSDQAVAPVPLWLPSGGRMRSSTDSVVRRCHLTPDDVTVRHGVPCLVAGRALLDVAAASPDLRAAVTALDMALSARVTTAREVRAQLQGRPGLRGAGQVRLALDLAEDRVLSPMESWLRLLWVLDAELPRPRCNWPVADLSGRRLGRPDLLGVEVGVVAEYDGAEHRSRARHGLDVRREADFRDAGLEVVTVVATDVPHPDRVVARMQAAVDRTRAADRPRGWMPASRPGRL